VNDRPHLLERHVLRVPFCTCHLWTGGVNNKGYGVFYMRGKRIGAHRAALIFAKGEPPFKRAQANHECDLPHCVNPDHLYWGTQKENIADMLGRNRTDRKGEKCLGKRLLTEAAVREIRSSTETNQALGAKYGVHRQTISSVRTRQSWRNI